VRDIKAGVPTLDEQPFRSIQVIPDITKLLGLRAQ